MGLEGGRCFVPRDYSAGSVPAFERRLPEALVGKLSAEAFGAAITGINDFFCEAERRSFARDLAQVPRTPIPLPVRAHGSTPLQCANCMLTGYTFDLCCGTRYQRLMVRAASLAPTCAAERPPHPVPRVRW